MNNLKMGGETVYPVYLNEFRRGAIFQDIVSNYEDYTITEERTVYSTAITPYIMIDNASDFITHVSIDESNKSIILGIGNSKCQLDPNLNVRTQLAMSGSFDTELGWHYFLQYANGGPIVAANTRIPATIMNKSVLYKITNIFKKEVILIYGDLNVSDDGYPDCGYNHYWLSAQGNYQII